MRLLPLYWILTLEKERVGPASLVGNIPHVPRDPDSLRAHNAMSAVASFSALLHGRLADAPGHLRCRAQGLFVSDQVKVKVLFLFFLVVKEFRWVKTSVLPSESERATRFTEHLQSYLQTTHQQSFLRWQ